VTKSGGVELCARGRSAVVLSVWLEVCCLQPNATFLAQLT
jgi:hypothetical protein